MTDASPHLLFELNGECVAVTAPPGMRLSNLLRDRLGLTGTKVGCDAGDCGACTVLVDGAPICSCLTAAGQVDGRKVETIEGLSETSVIMQRLQRSFLRHGAAQCGICTPGMLVTATALLDAEPSPSAERIEDQLGGVLCRCTGYRKILEAVLDAGSIADPEPLPRPGEAVGARMARLDGQRKVEGSDVFGADDRPAEALALRVVRSPHDHAQFVFGDLDTFVSGNAGIQRVFTAADVPGRNCYGVIPRFADQPVFAEGTARFRGEAVAAVVGEPAALERLDLAAFPVSWTALPAIATVEDALAEGAELVHPGRAGNVLIAGRVARGDVDAALAGADVLVEGSFETGFVEHAYIEPEAGFARRIGDRLEVQACTQSPYMDRDDIAAILGVGKESVRIIPTAVGGGFGAKLDLSVQPFLAVAAWHLDRPVRMVYSRPESMASTTKRHPAMIRARAGASRDGRLLALDFEADFNTGAYSSWGPTVANRVPVHASGPYNVPNYRARTRAVHTHLVPAGAFRGFGVPQTAIAQEQLYDELADALGMDRLDFRILNALGAGDETVTGQVIGDGVGIKACLEALKEPWVEARAAAASFNADRADALRRGVGVAGMWYGCGNTSLPNPSTMRIGLKPDGRIALHQGAVDIGQGANTIMAQIAADTLGVAIGLLDIVGADTDLTPDCGKTSASRQTFVTGKATELAARDLRTAILRHANAGEGARIELQEGRATIRDMELVRTLDLLSLPRDELGYVLRAERTFDPPTTPLDENGQGSPYAVYGFGAHMAEVEVDLDLGTVHVMRITAAHDVGRAINPTLVEGQIEGGIAQGLGMALMEEFLPGRGENLHDYLIPTIGDVPEIRSILIEDPSPAGPFGAKGVGEQALIPTAPAILNGIHDATGVRLRRVPATPDRVRSAILAGEACILRAVPLEGESRVHVIADPGPSIFPSVQETAGKPVETEASAGGGKIRCDACPVLCYIREGAAGACDRYANVSGELVRVDPHVVLERTLAQGGTVVPFSQDAAWDGNLLRTREDFGGPETFVTAIGAGTTYPDYKPAPFIVSSEVEGVDMVTVVTEGIFSYCGVKVKIDTDRFIGAERSLVRAKGEPVGHVTTGEYGSQMLSLGGVHHLTGGSKKEGRVTCETLLHLCNGRAVELEVDEGAAIIVQANEAPVVNGVQEQRMRVGCGSATIGMFAKLWQGQVDEVVVVDDHITGVLSEHQAGKLLGMPDTGIKLRGRRSTPGRYFQVAAPGTGWGGTDISDPLSILAPFDPKVARPGLTMLMVSTTGEHHGFFVLDETLRPVEAELPQSLALAVERIRENCEPALSTVLFMGGAGGSLRSGVTDNPVRLTRSVRDALTTVTCGGAPVYIWPGGGITFMVDVARMPENAFGYVPTPALVAPIEFSLRLSDYAALGGHMEEVRPLASLAGGQLQLRPRPGNPWPLARKESKR
jgi:aldehyde oxidoreductase